MVNKPKSRDKTELTTGELEALEMQKQGLSYSQIGARLGISRKMAINRIQSARIRIRAKEHKKKE